MMFGTIDNVLHFGQVGIERLKEGAWLLSYMYFKDLQLFTILAIIHYTRQLQLRVCK